MFHFIGYVQSLIRRVVNNVNIVINNLILKYVEDDIVLSVNITSAECYTVDEFWDRAFMDISGEWICFGFRYHCRDIQIHIEICKSNKNGSLSEDTSCLF